MAKSKFTNAAKKPRRKRTPKTSGGSGKRSNAWRQYTGGGHGGGGRYVPSNEPLPD
jgi:hypothetical protein